MSLRLAKLEHEDGSDQRTISIDLGTRKPEYGLSYLFHHSAGRGWLKLYERTNYHQSRPIRNSIHLAVEAQGVSGGAFHQAIQLWSLKWRLWL